MQELSDHSNVKGDNSGGDGEAEEAIRRRGQLERELILSTCKLKSIFMKQVWIRKKIIHLLRDSIPACWQERSCRGFAKAVVRVFEQREYLLGPFVCYAVSLEIEAAENENLLFREESLAVELWHEFFKVVGRPQLMHLSPLIRDIARHPPPVEVDPSRLTQETKLKEVQKNRRNLLQVTQRFFECVLRSMNECSSALREVIGHVYKTVEQYFPGTEFRVLGGLLYLRFFCPAIVSPLAFNLLSEDLPSEARRCLVLVAKLLQTLANEATFEKEEYMLCFNPFITENTEKMRSAFRSLTGAERTDPPDEGIDKDEEINIDEADEVEEILLIFDVLKENMESLKLETSTEECKNNTLNTIEGILKTCNEIQCKLTHASVLKDHTSEDAEERKPSKNSKPGKKEKEARPKEKKNKKQLKEKLWDSVIVGSTNKKAKTIQTLLGKRMPRSSGPLHIDWTDRKGTIKLQRSVSAVDECYIVEHLDFYKLAKCLFDQDGGIKLKDHRSYLRVFKNCFVGSECVEWISAKLQISRYAALLIGKKLMEFGYLNHVTNERSFADCNFLYYPNWKALSSQVEEDTEAVGAQCSQDSNSETGKERCRDEDEEMKRAALGNRFSLRHMSFN